MSNGLIHILCHIFFSAPKDYEATHSSNITFSPAQTLATVSVTIVDDDVLEDVEQFTVEVVATGGQERVDVGDAANISISDDDCEKDIHFQPFKCFIVYVCLFICDSYLHACMSVCVCLFSHLPACLPATLSVSVSHKKLTGLFASDSPNSSLHTRNTIIFIINKHNCFH